MKNNKRAIDYKMKRNRDKLNYKIINKNAVTSRKNFRILKIKIISYNN